MRQSLLGVVMIGVALAMLMGGGCPKDPDVAGANNLAPTIGEPSLSGQLVAGQLCTVTVSCIPADEDGTIQAVEADLSAIGGDGQQALTAASEGHWVWTGQVSPPTAGTLTVTLIVTDDAKGTTTAIIEVEVAPVGGGDDNGGGGNGGTNQPPVFGNISIQGDMLDIYEWPISIACNVSDPDGSVDYVIADLSAVDSRHDLPMNVGASGQWTLEYPVAPRTPGTRTITFKAVDDKGAETTCSTTIQINRHPIPILRDLRPGANHTLAIKDDGTLVQWGDNTHGQTEPQAGNNFWKVAASDGYSLALREDGSIVAWGYGEYGQTTAPAGPFKEIAAAAQHAVGIRQDGTLVAWGRDLNNSLAVPGGAGWVAVAALYCPLVALRDDGTVAHWGFIGNEVAFPGGSDYVAVAAGGYHLLALKQNGTVVAWGDNQSGECNVPPDTYQAIAAGYMHSTALRTDGSLVVWGNDMYGQISETPKGNDFVAIWASFNYSVAKRSDGSLVVWGADSGHAWDVPKELQ